MSKFRTLDGRKQFDKIGSEFYNQVSAEKTELRNKTENILQSYASIYSHVTVTTKTPNLKDALKDIIRFRRIRNATLTLSATFFVIAMVYMGISYNAAELPGM